MLHLWSTAQDHRLQKKGTKRTIDRNHRDNGDNLEGKRPKKRGRPSAYHPYQPHSPCSIWLQTGRDVCLAHHHVSDWMGHPGKNAALMSTYVSQSGVRISLQSDSCICKGYELDFLHNKNNFWCPHWLKLRDDTYTQRHCILCCTTSTNCQCMKVQEWGPSTWYGDQSVEWWGKYFIHKRMCQSINPNAKDLCRVHLREYRRCSSNRVCIKCSTNFTEKWYISGKGSTQHR